MSFPLSLIKIILESFNDVFPTMRPRENDCKYNEVWEQLYRKCNSSANSGNTLWGL